MKSWKLPFVVEFDYDNNHKWSVYHSKSFVISERSEDTVGYKLKEQLRLGAMLFGQFRYVHYGQKDFNSIAEAFGYTLKHNSQFMFKAKDDNHYRLISNETEAIELILKQ